MIKDVVIICMMLYFITTAALLKHDIDCDLLSNAQRCDYLCRLSIKCIRDLLGLQVAALRDHEKCQGAHEKPTHSVMTEGATYATQVAPWNWKPVFHEA